MKILMLDNYDSFTYNLVQMLEELEGVKVTVRRNDEITLSEVEPFEKIVLSCRRLCASSPRPRVSSACAWGTNASAKFLAERC